MNVILQPKQKKKKVEKKEKKEIKKEVKKAEKSSSSTKGPGGEHMFQVSAYVQVSRRGGSRK